MKAKRGIWKMRDGRFVEISSMGIGHLFNTLRMLETNGRRTLQDVGVQVYDWKPNSKYAELEREFQQRSGRDWHPQLADGSGDLGF